MSKKKSKVLQKQELLYYALESETGYSSNTREIFKSIDSSFLERKLKEGSCLLVPAMEEVFDKKIPYERGNFEEGRLKWVEYLNDINSNTSSK